jgi:formate-dependent nitrite reductase cytochrome c552 subunit
MSRKTVACFNCSSPDAIQLITERGSKHKLIDSIPFSMKRNPTVQMVGLVGRPPAGKSSSSPDKSRIPNTK